VFTGFCAVDVLPSPKSHDHPVGLPVLVSVNLTVRGETPPELKLAASGAGVGVGEGAAVGIGVGEEVGAGAPVGTGVAVGMGVGVAVGAGDGAGVDGSVIRLLGAVPMVAMPWDHSAFRMSEISTGGVSAGNMASVK